MNLDEQLNNALNETHRIGVHSDDYGGDSDKPCYCNVKQSLKSLIKDLLDEVIGEDEPLTIPEYPSVDDEGEPLWSKNAAKEGRKQVTQRYHNRKDLRKEQRAKAAQILEKK